MRRSRAILRLSSCALFLCALIGCAPAGAAKHDSAQEAGRRAAEEAPLAIEDCVVALLDEKAGSAERIRAIEALGELPADQVVVALPGLLRAVRSNDGRESDAARGVLANEDLKTERAALEELARKRHASLESDRSLLYFTAHLWAKSRGGWDDAPRLAQMTQAKDSRVRKLALDIVLHWMDRPGEMGMRRLDHGDIEDDAARVQLARALIAAAERDPLQADKLIKRLRRLVWDRPEFRPVFVDSLRYRWDFQLDAWQAVEGLCELSPSGIYMTMAISELIAAYESGRSWGDRRDDQVAAIVRRLTPAGQAAVVRAVSARIRESNRASVPLLAEIRDPPLRLILGLLNDPDGDVRLQAARILQKSSVRGDGVTGAWRKRLDDPDERVRTLAAEVLGTADAERHARLRGLLIELKGETPEGRGRAALQLQEARLEAPEIGAALVRAVRARDLAVREGLILAIEGSLGSGRTALEVLKELAAKESDPARRACARAALREVEGLKKERP
jgi:hypothetical protein